MLLARTFSFNVIGGITLICNGGELYKITTTELSAQAEKNLQWDADKTKVQQVYQPSAKRKGIYYSSIRIKLNTIAYLQL